jgi:hypothetical protein
MQHKHGGNEITLEFPGGYMSDDKDKSASRVDWATIVTKARVIVSRYDTGVTLRQLFYQLVSNQTLPNSEYAYKKLSERTAAARRMIANPFPDLLDLVPHAYQLSAWGNSADFAAEAIPQFHLDRTLGQPYAIWLVVEKNGIVAQLKSWFSRYGIHIVGLGGFASQTLCGMIKSMVEVDGRPAVLIYAGDHDASGDELEADFVVRTGCWTEHVRIALTKAQIAEFHLPINPGRPKDKRQRKFCLRHGYDPQKPVQVELDALSPETLRTLYQNAFDAYWDVEAYGKMLSAEEAELTKLKRLTKSL